MHEDFDQVQGWPAEGTRVYADTTRIGPRVLTRERREECREANVKWLTGSDGKSKKAASQKAWRQKSRLGSAA
jgi:hypothetical protein